MPNCKRIVRKKERMDEHTLHLSSVFHTDYRAGIRYR